MTQIFNGNSGFGVRRFGIEPLSNDELHEMQRLSKQLEEERKQKVREVFISTPSFLREIILTEISIDKCYCDMGNVTVDVPKRLAELQQKQDDYHGPNRMRVRVDDGASLRLDMKPRILEFFTEKEVIEMHKDASIMEMMDEQHASDTKR